MIYALGMPTSARPLPSQLPHILCPSLLLGIADGLMHQTGKYSHDNLQPCIPQPSLYQTWPSLAVALGAMALQRPASRL